MKRVKKLNKILILYCVIIGFCSTINITNGFNGGNGYNDPVQFYYKNPTLEVNFFAENYETDYILLQVESPHYELDAYIVYSHNYTEILKSNNYSNYSNVADLDSVDDHVDVNIIKQEISVGINTQTCW